MGLLRLGSYRNNFPKISQRFAEYSQIAKAVGTAGGSIFRVSYNWNATESTMQKRAKNHLSFKRKSKFVGRSLLISDG